MLVTIKVTSNLISGVYAVLADFILVWIIAKLITVLLRLLLAKVIYDDREKVYLLGWEVPIFGVTIRRDTTMILILTAIMALIPILTLVGGFSITGETNRPVQSIEMGHGIIHKNGKVGKWIHKSLLPGENGTLIDRHLYALTFASICAEANISQIQHFNIMVKDSVRPWATEEERQSDELPMCLNRQNSGELNLGRKINVELLSAPTVFCTGVQMGIINETRSLGSRQMLGRIIEPTELRLEKTCSSGFDKIVCGTTNFRNACVAIEKSEDRVQAYGSTAILLTREGGITFQSYVTVDITKDALAMNDTEMDEYKFEAIMHLILGVHASQEHVFGNVFYHSYSGEWKMLGEPENVTKLNLTLLLIPIGIVIIAGSIIGTIILCMGVSKKHRRRMKYAIPSDANGLATMAVEGYQRSDDCKYVINEIRKAQCGVWGEEPHFGPMTADDEPGKYEEKEIKAAQFSLRTTMKQH